VLGEMGYKTGKRIATAIVEEPSYLAQITEDDLNAMGGEAKKRFERNLDDEYNRRVNEIYELLNQAEKKMLAGRKFITEETKRRTAELSFKI
jgi:hypothetical protein